MEKGENVSIYLARIDEIVDLLTPVEVEKKESEVHHHKIRHLSNDYDTEKRSSLQNPAHSRERSS